MWINNETVAAGHSIAPARWSNAFAEVMARIAGRFARVETRRRAGHFVLGLLSDLPTKNCWTIAEHAGEATPDGMQHLPARASGDTDAVRADIADYVTEHLHDEHAVLVVDETGDLKKGARTAGVQRQYTGTAGRIENSQVAVYSAYAARHGHAVLDRELYLPRCWSGDPRRREEAGIDPEAAFATKPQLAAGMIERFCEAGHRAAWVAGDEVYGDNPGLRARLEARGMGYVMAVARNREVATPAGRFRADALAAKVPARSWQRVSAGTGAKGQRYYDWAVLDAVGEQAGSYQLLLRRSRSSGELAFYRCYAPEPVPLGVLVHVAGSRWRVEEAFQSAKGLTGLDEHQVKRWISWRRWSVLAMLAYAFLAVLRVQQRTEGIEDPEMVPLS